MKKQSSKSSDNGRFIGIRHRVKQTTKGEARPTQIAILSGNKVVRHDLKTEDDELDLVERGFPIKFRAVKPDEDLKPFNPRHIKWRKVKKTDALDSLPENLLRQEGKTWKIATKVPIAFEGLQTGDTVAMVLGSGGYLAHALSRKGSKIGAEVLCIPSNKLKDQRPDEDKEKDAELLARLAQERPDLFNLLELRDRIIIHLRLAVRAREDAQEARIACGNRLRARMVGEIFCREDEESDFERSLEEEYARRKASDIRHQALLEEEKENEQEITRIVKELEIYKEVFEPIMGCGPMIAAAIIAETQDIRRFPGPPQYRKYCDLHVLPDGRLPRKRKGDRCNNPRLRRAFYQLASDQLVRLPDSEWGKIRQECKDNFREKHPDVLCKDCSLVLEVLDTSGEKPVWRYLEQDEELSGFSEEQCRWRKIADKDRIGLLPVESLRLTRWEDCEHQKSHHRMYNDGHIHRMATWRTATRLANLVFREWWKLEKERQQSKQEVKQDA